MGVLLFNDVIQLMHASCGCCEAMLICTYSPHDQAGLWIPDDGTLLHACERMMGYLAMHWSGGMTVQYQMQHISDCACACKLSRMMACR